MHKCRGETCKHSEHKEYVGPEGSLDSDIMFVGLGPGQDEVDRGRPFVGPAGYRFDVGLRHGGIRREECYVTNAVKYWPPGHKIQNLPEEDRDRFKKQLHNELYDFKGEIIVPMGNDAIRAVIDHMEVVSPRTQTKLKPQVSKWRGSILKGRTPAGRSVLVIPTVHPSSILYTFDYNVLFLTDMKKIGKVLRGGSINSIYRSLYTPSHPRWIEQVQELIGHCEDDPLSPLACDIEVYEGRLACCSFALGPSWAVSVPADTHMETIKKMLNLPNPKVWHNAMYDLTFLEAKEGIVPKGKQHDTMLMWHSLHPELSASKNVGRSLALLASLYTMEPYYKDERENWKKVDDFDRFYRYNALDAAVTIEIYFEFAEKLVKEGVQNVYEFMLRLIEPFKRATIRGVPVDTSKKTKALGAATGDLEALEEKLSALDQPINFRSWQQLLGAFKRLGIGCKNTSKEEIVRVLVKETNPISREYLEALLEYKAKEKHRGSYLSFEPDADRRYRPSWRIAGTETGRLSCSGKSIIFNKGPSLQTIPDEDRIHFKADPGWFVMYADLDQAELRLVAYLSGCEKLIETLDSEDIFGEMVKQTGLERTVVKNTWYGSVYGGGPRTLATTVNTRAGYQMWTEADAKLFQEVLFSTYPEVSEWQDFIEDYIGKRFTIRTLFGRKRYFRFRGRSVDEHSHREALNFVPQGTVPDIVSKAILDVDYWDTEYGVWQLWAHMHDGIVGQVLDDGAALDFMEELSVFLMRPIEITDIRGESRTCVIPVTISTGPNWFDLTELEDA